MFDPVSTYRIQFHKGFNFDAFENIIPYLQRLGIKTVYASPIFSAVPGSMHGYDVTDPTAINPEIGTLEQLKNVRGILKKAGISWIQDIVPNHMALHQGNAWLMDVLENGLQSAYADYFDIDWEHPKFVRKLILPVLGTTLEEAIDKGDVILVEYEPRKIMVKCNDSILPISHASCDMLVENARNEIGKYLEAVNSNKPALKKILTDQHYILRHWQATDTSINYRRFFTINGLISLNIQHEKVFNDYHKLIKQLCDEDIFQGVRVDHIDGLYDPVEYLYKLRKIIGDEKYIVVEKILEPREELSRHWPIHGTTGYDFLGAVNNLFTNKKSKPVFEKFYSKEIGDIASYKELLHDKKGVILSKYMGGEVENLYRLLMHLDLIDNNRLNSIFPSLLKNAISELLIQCPVYKYYGDEIPLSADEGAAMKTLLDNIGNRDERLVPYATILKEIFLDTHDTDYHRRAIRFYKRCMQFTGPVMAKGVEDTLMYSYNRFIGHNEVGDAPNSFGHSVATFHKFMEERQKNWPLAMNATATHDTKRGEDARARLNVITDMADEWVSAVTKWEKQYNAKKEGVDTNDAYFIYQSLVACHPMPECSTDDFATRFKAYIQKAIREAKVHTEWAKPNEEYEASVSRFLDKVIEEALNNNEMNKLFVRIADAGIINSLSQVVFRLTCPGMPDTYQGTEVWDLSMVDPDNRRPVDYKRRATWLEEILSVDQIPLSQLWQDRHSGKIKLWLTKTLLHERRAEVNAFTAGIYLPLKVKGKYKDNIIAFARRHNNIRYLIVLPLHIALLTKSQKVEVTDIDWADTSVILPDDFQQEWINVLTNTKKAANKSLAIKDVFNVLPIAVLKAKAASNERSAGVLMPVFSLSSPFGIGDFGSSAYKFIDFLEESRQKYWQLLPLNPTVETSAHSPYSSVCGMATNTLFISPELLVKEGLLSQEEINHYIKKGNAKIDYEQCVKQKKALGEVAYTTFLSGSFKLLKYKFENFCLKQSYWLRDFALYEIIKEKFNGQPWYEWPDEYKKRDTGTLQNFETANNGKLEKVKWLQFITNMQWQELRKYCNGKEIRLFGDMPFYMSYDSVEVWASPSEFSVDLDGNMTHVAGVPPDYFSETGQLWNMPIYNWDVLKANNYSLWIKKLKRNLELFDVIRLDHFRAFEAYWEVPAGAENAVGGKWVKGPGMDFFNSVNKQIGSLPFIAEDLGYEIEDVYILREKTGLPGMKVLQFAWGDNMPGCVDIPHNYTANCIVYTGTHDNNTTLGWYKNELAIQGRKRMERYIGHRVTEHNVADTLCRLAYSSIAKIAILPIQDVLGHDKDARINIPGSSADNWIWRISDDALNNEIKKKLTTWVTLYNR